jgi:ATP-dependent Lhr-like helicase
LLRPPVPGPAPASEAAAEAFARQLLRRWGVVLRELVARETLAPAWREMLVALRRMEARGEIRGGRFAGAFVGEQFALPEALDLLRALRRQSDRAEALEVSAADPLNLAGILLPGPRLSATSGEMLRLEAAG